MKLAFLSFEEEVELRIDEDIIDVYQDEAMEVLSEHLVHEVLKYGGGGALTRPYGITKYS